jgi:hypothetical protein
MASEEDAIKGMALAADSATAARTIGDLHLRWLFAGLPHLHDQIVEHRRRENGVDAKSCRSKAC